MLFSERYFFLLIIHLVRGACLVPFLDLMTSRLMNVGINLTYDEGVGLLGLFATIAEIRRVCGIDCTWLGGSKEGSNS
jgi:hypothetical protein